MTKGKRGDACVFHHGVGRSTFSVRGRPSDSEHMGDVSHDHDAWLLSFKERRIFDGKVDIWRSMQGNAISNYRMLTRGD